MHCFDLLLHFHIWRLNFFSVRHGAKKANSLPKDLSIALEKVWRVSSKLNFTRKNVQFEPKSIIRNSLQKIAWFFSEPRFRKCEEIWMWALYCKKTYMVDERYYTWPNFCKGQSRVYRGKGTKFIIREWDNVYLSPQCDLSNLVITR